MSRFLASDTFDDFFLESAVLKLATTYTIDGHINRDFYEDGDEAPEYALAGWALMRPMCLELIKGRHTPVSFRFVMCASPKMRQELLAGDEYSEARSAVSELVFIVGFKDGELTITTGAALSGFILDKSYERQWDGYIKSIIADAGLEFEDM